MHCVQDTKNGVKLGFKILLWESVKKVLIQKTCTFKERFCHIRCQEGFVEYRAVYTQQEVPSAILDSSAATFFLSLSFDTCTSIMYQDG